MWLVTALGLVAQALLFSIILTSNSYANLGREIACALSLAIALAALFIVHNDRKYQAEYRRWMIALEEAFDFPFVALQRSSESDRRTADVDVGRPATSGHEATHTSPRAFLGTISSSDATIAWLVLWWTIIAADVAALVIIATSNVNLFLWNL